MAFNVASFSSEGLTLLSQLSSSKSLRIKHIYVDESTHTVSDLEQTPSWWSTQTAGTMAKVNAVLAASSEVSDQARLIIKINLKSGQTQTISAKTIIITACGVESGVETPEITFCGVSDTNGLEILYNSSDIRLSTSIAIYFKFDTASSITFEEAIDPDYAIHSDLDRFLSCHAVGDPTGGEDQAIRGVKTFYEGAVIDIYEGFLSFNSGDTERARFEDTGTDYGLQFTALNVDQPDAEFFTFCADSSTVMSMSTDSNGTNYKVAITGTLTASDIATSTLDAESISSISASINGINISRLYDGLGISGNVSPVSNNISYLGLPNNRWRTVYSNEFRATTGYSLDTANAHNNTLIIGEDEGDLLISGFTAGHGLILGQMYEGSTVGDRAPIYCGDIYNKNLTATGDVTVKGTIHGNIDGTIPVPDNSTDIPIGCICILKSSLETLRGDQFSKTADGQTWMNRRTAAACSLNFGDLNDSTSSGDSPVFSYYTSATRFLALSHADAAQSFLAIRIA